MKRTLLLFFLVAAVHLCNAQDSMAAPSQFEFQGYVNTLQKVTWANDEYPQWSSTIQNRLNARWRISGRSTLAAEIRNRMFFGEDIRRIPGFADRLSNPNEYFDLQKVWKESRSMVFHTNIERLYFDYQGDKIGFRAGRQRINWGMTTTWNPNDLFNTYNFLDFDYPERPGSDGVKASYKISPDLSTEFAYTLTGNHGGNIAAARISYNRWNYDWQFISGIYRNNFTLGLGWAGAVKSAGFKGEAQYFAQNGGLFNVALETDYMFKNGWYANIGVLFNDHGTTDRLPLSMVGTLIQSPESLMPTKWTLIGSTAKEFSPLLSFRTSIVFSPGTNLFIFYPSLKYSVMPDFDVDLVLQSFFLRQSSAFENLNNSVFVKASWSF